MVTLSVEMSFILSQLNISICLFIASDFDSRKELDGPRVVRDILVLSPRTSVVSFSHLSLCDPFRVSLGVRCKARTLLSSQVLPPGPKIFFGPCPHLV